MWPFKPVSRNETTKDEKIELSSPIELNKLGPYADAQINDALKAMDYFSYYDQMMNSGGGNYFGVEFNIQANAQRMKSAFSREPWMWATAQLIARTLSTVPFIVRNTTNGEVNENHPLNKRIDSSNVLQDDKSLKWAGYLDLVLCGNFFQAFDENYSNSMQVPAENVQLDYPTSGLLIHQVTVLNPVTGRVSKVPYKNLIHFKLPNPFNPYYGLSLYLAASRPILLDRFKNEFEMGFYLKGATNAGVVETTEDLSKGRLERLMRTFEAAYTGKRNWFRTIFLPKGAKWIKAGLSMQEMQHLESMRENRLSILACLGIPPSKLGIVEDVNRSTSEIQDVTFWENTIKPLAHFVAAGWNNSYLVKAIYKSSVYVEPDFTGIEALQGSLTKKGDQVAAVEKVWTVDEVRKEIFGKEPIGDERGSKLVIEISKSSPPSLSSFLTAPSAQPAIPQQAAVQDVEPVDHIKESKSQAVAAQDRIESKYADEFQAGYDGYLSELLGYVEEALKENRDVTGYLQTKERELEKKYILGVGPSLLKALDRGFSSANALVKSFNAKVHIKQRKISTTDQQAIDALKETQADGKRSALTRLALERFVGFNETRSKEILDLIVEGLESGKTQDQIAASIRQDYGEKYPGQSNTISRTEILTAISQGIDWNHDVLKEVFTKVQKQWFHVGDVGINPHARMQHYGFEQEGAVDSDHVWGGVLRYPRDPNAGPEQVINCRCSMTSIIPPDASSNAEIILDRI
jgi:HK97 family phage portal protein